ncbi:unnamed protein product [Protopolystoma xenopodis]|uniref:Uncharacterized protein n=1 Tax=Protopolystoma xenopodis TaxID=117903 RepID=A0A448WWM0_9PLAT|nr:unnamed protein product [Protopolystoma xenopodis]
MHSRNLQKVFPFAKRDADPPLSAGFLFYPIPGLRMTGKETAEDAPPPTLEETRDDESLSWNLEAANLQSQVNLAPDTFEVRCEFDNCTCKRRCLLR